MLSQILTDTLMIFLITYALVDILYKLLKFLNRPFDKNKTNTKIIFFATSAQNLENEILNNVKTANNLGVELYVVLKDESEEILKILDNLKLRLPYLNIINSSENPINQIF